MSTIDVFFQSIKLPVMPEVAHALIAAMNKENVSSHEIRSLIAKDAALTARLLRLANSASFGLKCNVATLEDAIALVGMDRVRTLALAASIGDAFPTVKGLNRADFWNSCMACAGYGQWLALQIGADTNEAWLACMMVRLGELLIAEAEPNALAEIECLPLVPGCRWEREIRITGFSEGQIMAELARRWYFPTDIPRALDAAADPMAAKPFNRLAAIVHLASLLADMPPSGSDMLDALPPEVVNALQLRDAWVKEKFPVPQALAALS